MKIPQILYLKFYAHNTIIMPKYIFAYHGGKKPENPEEGARGREKWQAWINGLGDAVINPGTPLGKSKTISSSGVSDTDESNIMTGYAIVKADSMDNAIEIAKGDPFLEMGTVEVAEIMEME